MHSTFFSQCKVTMDLSSCASRVQPQDISLSLHFVLSCDAVQGSSQPAAGRCLLFLLPKLSHGLKYEEVNEIDCSSIWLSSNSKQGKHGQTTLSLTLLNHHRSARETPPSSKITKSLLVVPAWIRLGGFACIF